MSAVVKRVLDLCLSTAGLILCAPVAVAIALAVRVSMGSPVLFRQVRPGLEGEPFTMYKFRTMLDLRNEAGELLPDAERLTWVGKFLRSTSLDELPQLFNVLKGDMSLVGPRPLLVEYIPFYTEREKLRHTVRPGMTGWAQVNGRNRLCWNRRLEMDAWYVENGSLLLDLRILGRTLTYVFRRQGVVVDPAEVETDLVAERRAAQLCETGA
jgi:sugar transferase EpsL